MMAVKTVEILAGLNYYYEFITGEVNNSRTGERVTLKSVFFICILSRQYKIYSAFNLDEMHLLKVHTETDVNVSQKSFKHLLKHLLDVR